MKLCLGIKEALSPKLSRVQNKMNLDLEEYKRTSTIKREGNNSPHNFGVKQLLCRFYNVVVRHLCIRVCEGHKEFPHLSYLSRSPKSASPKCFEGTRQSRHCIKDRSADLCRLCRTSLWSTKLPASGGRLHKVVDAGFKSWAHELNLLYLLAARPQQQGAQIGVRRVQQLGP